MTHRDDWILVVDAEYTRLSSGHGVSDPLSQICIFSGVSLPKHQDGHESLREETTMRA